MGNLLFFLAILEQTFNVSFRGCCRLVQLDAFIINVNNFGLWLWGSAVDDLRTLRGSDF